MATYSDIGSQLGGPSGIQSLMEDLGTALTMHPGMRMLGGGQPAAIPEVQELWRDQMQRLVSDGPALDRMLLNYDPPGGNPIFRETFAHFLSQNCGWSVKKENVGIMPSSQTAFFLLFNLLAGEAGGTKKRILFPLVPEYIGYASQGLSPGMFTSCRALIEEHGEHEFKYRIDFDRLEITPDIAAICVSCPTNPTGNVLTEEEFKGLRELTQKHGIPLIIDNAYGHPFPGVIYNGFQPKWEPGMIFSISMSKVGLPGVRTAMIVADPDIVSALANMNASVSLANGNLGQAIMSPLLKDDRLLRIGPEVIRPYYKKRSDHAVSILSDALGDTVPWALHAREGAFFLWLWIKGLRISSAELYQKLKAREVLVIPGHYFFFGLDEPWEHSQQCVRLTFSQPESVVQEGLEILADEIIKNS